jgi:hypothetical protein
VNHKKSYPDLPRSAWLKHRELKIKRLINLARGWAELDAVPTDPVWRPQFDNLIIAARRKELTARKDDPGNPDSFYSASAEEYWAFACNSGPDWEWLREFCEEWAAGCSVTLPVIAAPPLAAAEAAVRGEPQPEPAITECAPAGAPAANETPQQPASEPIKDRNARWLGRFKELKRAHSDWSNKKIHNEISIAECSTPAMAGRIKKGIQSARKAREDGGEVPTVK